MFLGFSRWLLFALVVTSFAGCGIKDESHIRKKRMPDLQYVYSTQQNNVNIEKAIAGSLDLYSSDPRLFGDPVGIINSFADSVGFKPLGRLFGLILADPNWFSDDSLLLNNIIPGGTALSMIFDGRYESLDSCWNEIHSYALYNNLGLVPPGIEVYRGQGADSLAAVTELIIRLK